MDAEAAKLIGAGLAAIGAGMAALGVGNVFGSFLESALRNPAAADGQQGRLFIGFAAAELLGLLAFVVSMILIRSEEHTSELQSLMRISYAVFCLTKKKKLNLDIKRESYLLYTIH